MEKDLRQELLTACGWTNFDNYEDNAGPPIPLGDAPKWWPLHNLNGHPDKRKGSKLPDMTLDFIHWLERQLGVHIGPGWPYYRENLIRTHGNMWGFCDWQQRARAIIETVQSSQS